MDVLFTSPLGRAAALVALLAVTTLGWYIASRRAGRMRPAGRLVVQARPVFDLAAVGATERVPATFVQFSSAVCSPCRHVARVLTALSATEEDVAHIELDVAQHPDLVRTYGVMRTPTVLLVGADGTIHGRATGAMTAVQARDAVAALHLSEPCSPAAP